MAFKRGHTVLFPVCFPCSNQPEAARLLLDAGANINCKNLKGNTPLMIAGALGHYNLLEILANHPKINIQAEVALSMKDTFMFSAAHKYNRRIILTMCQQTGI